jgi:hypothetical protein
MDFAAVFHITEKPSAATDKLTGGARDRAELLARQRLVAASRPRDYLWIAYVSDPTEIGCRAYSLPSGRLQY